MAGKILTATFSKERETKNTVRFAEDGNSPIMGTLYLQNSASEQLGGADKIKVTIEAA